MVAAIGGVRRLRATGECEVRTGWVGGDEVGGGFGVVGMGMLKAVPVGNIILGFGGLSGNVGSLCRGPSRQRLALRKVFKLSSSVLCNLR